MTKVTYYIYPCDTCCMISEMMEMNGLYIVMRQIVKKRNIDEIFEMLNE